MTPSLSVKTAKNDKNFERTAGAETRPRRTIRCHSVIPISETFPHSVTVPHGRFRHGNNRAELRSSFRTLLSHFLSNYAVFRTF